MSKYFLILSMPIILLSVFLLNFKIVSAAGWVELADLTNSTIYSIDSFGEQVYAVGSGGEILYSHDGGRNWRLAYNPTESSFRAVAAFKENLAVAVGENGAIIRTVDGGQFWARIYADQTYTTKDFYSLAMTSDGGGYIVGEKGAILSGSADGKTWRTIVSPTSQNLFNVKSVSSHVWAVGANGTLVDLSSSPAILVDLSIVSSLNVVDFFDASYGWLGGAEGWFFITKDGGVNWEKTTIKELKENESILTFDFLSTGSGYLEGSSGTHLVTRDGGITWSKNLEIPEAIFVRSFSLKAGARYLSGVLGKILKFDDANPTAPESFALTSSDTSTQPSFAWLSSTDPDTEIDHYEMKIDDGIFTDLGLVNEYTWPGILYNSDHNAYLRAVDSAGNFSPEVSVGFSFTGSTEQLLEKVWPATAVLNTEVKLKIKLKAVGLNNCHLFINDQDAGEMTVVENIASLSQRFDETGNYSLYPVCNSVEGIKNTGETIELSVAPSLSEATPGELIKLACTEGFSVNDPCTAVYFYGTDGYRHAFPNASVYYSWYNDFSNLKILSAELLASLPLGKNVTYRPVSRLVKFITNHTVYAVSYAGVLRPVADEAIAQALYGLEWNKQIDDIPDTFFSNYDFGEEIQTAKDFDKTAVGNSTTNINDVL